MGIPFITMGKKKIDCTHGVKRCYIYIYIIARVVSASDTRGVFVGTLLEINSPLMPFENFDFTSTQ